MNQNSVKTKSVPLWHVCDRNTCTPSTSKGSNCGGTGGWWYEIIPRLHISRDCSGNTVQNKVTGRRHAWPRDLCPGQETFHLHPRISSGWISWKWLEPYRNPALGQAPGCSRCHRLGRPPAEKLIINWRSKKEIKKKCFPIIELWVLPASSFWSEKVVRI